jgi:hypothetical protein
VEYVTSEDVVAQNDRVTIRWRDFDPDSDAKIRFSFRQGIDDAIPVEGRFSEDDRDDRVTLDTSALEPGRYNLVMEISDDDFVMGSSSWSQFQVIVPERAQPEAAPQQDEQPVQQQEEQQQPEQVAPPVQNQEAEQAQQQAPQAEAARQNQAEAVPAEEPQAQAAPIQQNQQQNRPEQNQAPQNQPAAVPVQQQQPQADNMADDNAVIQEAQEEPAAEAEASSAPAADVPLQPQNEVEPVSEPEASSADSGTEKVSSGFELNLPKVAASCSLNTSVAGTGMDGSLIGMILGVAGLIVLRRHSALDGRA